MPERLEPAAAIARAPREESLEREPVRRESREDEGGDRGRRAGDGANLDPTFHGAPDDAIPRVRDRGHAAVGDDRDVVPGIEPLDQFGRALVLVALEHRDEGRADLEGPQEATGPPRVLRRDDRHRGERVPGTVGEVAEVPDRRADEVEDAAHARPTISGQIIQISRAKSSRDGPTSASAYHGPMAEPHKDYSGTPLPKKLGVREGAKVYVAAAPQGFDAALGTLPTGVQRLRRPGSRMDVALLFVTEERDLRSRFAALAAGMDPAGRLWVAWPKKAAKLPTDLDFDTVQRIGLDAGLVDNKSASITETFQGLQFVYRLKDRPR